MAADANPVAIAARPAAAPVAPARAPARDAGAIGTRRIALALAAFALLAACGWLFPRWLTFLLKMAAGNGLVSLGIVGLARSLAVHVAPVAELFSIYIVMAVVLMFRPEGLFQRTQTRRI